MKKIIYAFLGVCLLASCSQEEVIVSENFETTNLKTMLPNNKLDTSNKGMYAGIIVANNTQFHGKIWINIENDSNVSALVETIEGENIDFVLKSVNGVEYTFESKRGVFTINIANRRQPKITDIYIDNTTGYSKVIKESENNKASIVLGSFDSAYFGTLNGTWDFIVDPTNPVDIAEFLVTTSSGLNLSDVYDNLEAGDPGCYNDGPYYPFFLEDTDPAVNTFEIYATNQAWFLNSGKLILYDFAFSKNICDTNGLDYNRFLGFPEATNAFFFDPPLDADCYNISGTNGLFVLINAAGDAVEVAGNITFDTSVLAPVPFSGKRVESRLSETHTTVMPVFQGMK